MNLIRTFISIISISCFALGQDSAKRIDNTPFNLIPPSHWNDFKITSYGYPKLARIAKIQGDVTIAIIYSADGTVKGIRAFSGPPQLRSTADSLGKDIKLLKLPKDANGPWISFFTLSFKYIPGSITIIPTPVDQIPSPSLVQTLTFSAP